MYNAKIIYNRSIHIFNINYYIALLRYKYKLLTLETYPLQHSTNIDLSLDTVLVYYRYILYIYIPDVLKTRSKQPSDT